MHAAYKSEPRPPPPSTPPPPPPLTSDSYEGALALIEFITEITFTM